MNTDFIDIHYAYGQLGLDRGASMESIREALANTLAYRFATRERKDEVERFAEFFAARGHFGKTGLSFAEIRAVYHQRAKELHPDKNITDKMTEERLKAMNAAYEIVDRIYREARDYYRKNEETRAAIETEARTSTAREAEANSWRKAPPRYTSGARPATSWEWPKGTEAQPANPLKYMAASVPRYIRLARLFYLPRHAIIGSRYVQYNAGQMLVYDVIMLPEREFMRARLSLGIEGHGSPELTMSRLTPAYIPTDTRMVFVPETEESPHLFAKTYFTEKFNLAAAA